MNGARPGRMVGKVVVVTGGASGIGRASAIRLATDGAVVWAFDVNRGGLDSLVVEHSRITPILCDVSDEVSVEAAFKTVIERQGRLDVVVANAGVMLFGKDAAVYDLDIEAWQQTLSINLTGMFLTCKHGVRSMRVTGSRGSLVCTSSPNAEYGLAPGFTAYCASKGGVHAMSRVMAVDCAPFGIRVNAVMPGFTASELTRNILTDENATKSLVERTLLKRAGLPEDIANVIAFLASDEAAYVTGAAYYVDGGLTAT